MSNLEPVDTTIADNLINVRQQIELACEQHSRETADVDLLAVSKTKPAVMVEAALAAEQYHFGENYLQDALEKIQAIDHPKLTWHFIGAIQSNKTKPIAENFSWVHTVCSSKVATRLSNQRPEHLPKLQILIQVNIDNEATKSGVLPDAVLDLIDTITSLPNIELRGLMAIPKSGTNFETQRDAFARLRQLLQEVNKTHTLARFDQLSMGMSGDLEAAIAEGSTMVRIGTAIFGARNT